MLEIHQKSDLDGYVKYINDLGISEEKIKVIEAFERGNVTGFALFEYYGDTVNIYYVFSDGDLYLFDGLVRTILFKASINGIDKAEICTDNYTELEFYRNLNFISNESNTIKSIESIMNECRNCKKN